MKNSLAAKRYAKSLMGLAQEKNNLDSVYKDMMLINETIKKSNDLDLLLKSPVVNTDKKQQILLSVFGKNISNLSTLFLDLISSKKRESLIQLIASSFIDQYKNFKNIIVTEVTSAISLDKKQLNSIVSLFENTNNSTYEIVEKVSPEIIGGFIIRVGDKQIDASISKELRELKKTFNENPYIIEY